MLQDLICEIGTHLAQITIRLAFIGARVHK